MLTTSIRLNVDTAQAQTQVDSMGDSLDELIGKLREATEAGDWRNAANLTMAMNNLKQAQRQTLVMANQSNAGQGGNAAGNAGNGIVNTANGAGNAVSNFASGNFAGATINATRNAGGSLRTSGKDLGAQGMAGLGGMLGGLGIGALVAGAVMQAGNALSDQYEKALNPMNNLNRTFGNNVNTNSMAENNRMAMDFYQSLSEEANKIGMALDDFAEAVVDMAKYGVGTYDKAKEMAQRSGSWANFTGADYTQVQNYLGLSSRYGDSEDSLSIAYGGAMASGLQKGQYGEFLNSLQKVMEDGIANGYMKTSEEIAGNLVMFSKLTGNDAMWKGEQGTSRLMKISSSIAGATNLQSVSDIIIATAAQGVTDSLINSGKFKDAVGADATGTYVDTMLLMERGLTPEMFGALGSAVESMEGNNIAARIERYRQMTGLNYKGALAVDEMYQRYKDKPLDTEELAKEIAALQQNADYQSDEQKRQAALNNIEKAVVAFGKESFNVKFSGLEDIGSAVNAIRDYLLGKKGDTNNTVTENTVETTSKKTGLTEQEVKENIAAASAATGYNYEEVANRNTNFEMQPIAEEMNAKGAMLRANSYEEKAKALGVYLRTDNVKSMITPTEYDRQPYLNLTTDMGNNEKDEAMLISMAKYGVDTPKEIQKVLNTFGTGQLGGKGEDAYNAYDSKSINVDEFISKFETMLSKLNFTVIKD